MNVYICASCLYTIFRTVRLLVENKETNFIIWRERCFEILFSTDRLKNEHESINYLILRKSCLSSTPLSFMSNGIEDFIKLAQVIIRLYFLQRYSVGRARIHVYLQLAQFTLRNHR